MPYADADKKREYQRNWVKNKKNKTYPFSVESAFGTITHEQLTSCSYDKLSKYDDCVKEGKQLVRGLKLDRVRLSALAVQACRIKHGGNSKDYATTPTLKRYAKAIGVPYRTLHRWVSAYNFLLIRVEPGMVLSFSAAQKVLKYKKLPGQELIDPMESYKKLVEHNPVEMAKYEVTRYLGASITQLENIKPSHVNEAAREKIHGLIVEIASYEKEWRK